MILARRRMATPTADPRPVIPTSAPWNAPTYLDLPTPDGSGQVVHPSVHDFGPGIKWHGFRYWMAMTPFPGSDDSLENPCILASNNGWQWVIPAGLTNPIYPEPYGGRFNSDPDITYDPRSDELVLIYREQQQDATHQTFYARSPDGVTWPHKATPMNWTLPATQLLSPCIIRRGEGDWLAYGITRDAWKIVRYTATSPEGPWSGPTVCTGTPATPWHMDIWWAGDRFHALLDQFGTSTDGLSCGTSSDGLAWTFGAPVMLPRPGEWDAELYRPTLTPHENGTHYRVWYSARSVVHSKNDWRTGYTELPKSLWPAPPA